MNLKDELKRQVDKLPEGLAGDLLEVLASDNQNQLKNFISEFKVIQKETSEETYKVNQLKAFIKSYPLRLPSDYKFNREELYE